VEGQSVTLDADTRRMPLTLSGLLLMTNTEIVVLILRAGDSDVHPLLLFRTSLKYITSVKLLAEKWRWETVRLILELES